jgi:F-type H+-transporting ATPase subunit b
MELITPSIGLIFWMTISFSIVLWILAKFAWKPIMKSLHDREDSIETALQSAEKAKEEMKQLQFSNEQLLKDAKEERDGLMRDAKKIKDKLIEDAKGTAKEEAARIIESAKESIQNEKMAAITDLKNQLAILSIDIAEKILKEELSKTEKQKQLISNLLDDVNFN